MKRHYYISIGFEAKQLTCTKLEKRSSIFCILDQEIIKLSGSEFAQGSILNNQALHSLLVNSDLLLQNKQLPIIALIADFDLHNKTKKQLLSLQIGLLLARQECILSLVGPSLEHLQNTGYSPPQETTIWYWLAGSACLTCLIIGGCMLYAWPLSQKVVRTQESNQFIAQNIESTRIKVQTLQAQRKAQLQHEKISLLPKTLKTLSALIPDKIYLTDLSIEKNTVKISGLSAHAHDIEIFNNKLADSAHLKESQIKHIKQFNSNQSLLAFHLVSSIEQTT